MPVLIGTDEAGYGPNLGPLVITATSWSVPENFAPDDFWSCLAELVCQTASRESQRLHVADSKQVYAAGRSLEPLELSTLAFLALPGALPLTLRELGTQLAGQTFGDHYADEPWNDDPDLTVPVQACCDRILDFRERLQQTLQAHAIRLNSIRSRIIFPAEFNALVDQSGSKGQVLSTATLRLVREAVDECAEPLCGHVICDKHGGRNRYDDLIASAFDDQFVFRLSEAGPLSRYRMGQLEFCFRTRAEELLPVALASMVSKYLREVLMMHFNRFWQARIPGLKSTKGYPQDAQRFWLDIAVSVGDLQIDKHRLWRSR